MNLWLPTLDKPWVFVINLHSRAPPSWLSWNLWDSSFHKKKKKISSPLHTIIHLDLLHHVFMGLLKKICIFSSQSSTVLLHKDLLGQLTSKCDDFTALDHFPLAVLLCIFELQRNEQWIQQQVFYTFFISLTKGDFQSCINVTKAIPLFL